MSDKLMELFDLATEQYTPLPGKQAKTLSKILYNQKDLKKAEREFSLLFEKPFHMFSALMQTLESNPNSKSPKTV